MLISVTQEDINRGCRKNRGCCPVARAVKRKLNPIAARNVEVVRFYLLIASSRRYHFPREVSDFIRRFDNGEPVAPFTFTLPIDDLLGGET